MSDKKQVNEEELKQKLSPDAYRITREGARSLPLPENTTKTKTRVFTIVFAVKPLCSVRQKNMILVAVGQVTGNL